MSKRPETGTGSEDLKVRALRRSDWPHVEQLFGAKGACGGCWCMAWRRPRGGKLWEECKGEKNRAAFRELLESGKATGLLAFDKRVPVGWCSLGPREHFPKIDNSPSMNIAMPDRSWVVSCLFIAPEWRGRGLGERLLQEAVTYARQKKASAIFGYPARPPGGKKLPSAFAWTGVPVMYRRAGFRAVARTGFSRPVYRKVYD